MQPPLYDRQMVKFMWQELDAVGVKSLTTPQEVDLALARPGTTLMVVNSVCGCAAGNARPGVALALQNSKIPDQMFTVFAGVDRDAVEKARGYMVGVPPSSPCVALFRDGKLVAMLERKHIEGSTAEEVAERLQVAFDAHCTKTGPSVPLEMMQEVYGRGLAPRCGSDYRIPSK